MIQVNWILKRSNKSLARLFTGFKKMALDQVRRGCVVRDVQQYILGRLEKEAALRRHLSRETAPALNMLHIKSHGCLLYVETLLDGVSDGSVLLRDIPEIPGTLNGLYLWLCQRLFTRKAWIKVTYFFFHWLLVLFLVIHYNFIHLNNSFKLDSFK